MYDYLFKFIVVGDSGSGKSCLVLQFSDRRFEPIHDLTIGVEFASKIVYVEQKQVKLQIWDTAGAETFQSLTRSYYHSSSGVVLVYDVTRRETFKHIQHWLTDIRDRCHDKIAIILVGNKIDIPQRRAVTTSEGQSLAKQHGLLFCETSARTGQGVEDVFRHLAATVCKQLAKGEVIEGDHSGIKSAAPSKRKPLKISDLPESETGCCLWRTK
jgi:Ras-related protein Rab-2A